MAAVQTKLGINGSATVTSIDYLLRNAASTDPGHLHTIAAVSGLQAALDAKAALSHTHLISSVTDFPSQTGNGGKFLTTNGSALSWGTVLTGSGADTRVTYWTGASSLGSDAGLTWDAANDTLTVTGAADAKRLVLKAHSPQTANLQEWQNSSGTMIAAVSGAGNINLDHNAPFLYLNNDGGAANDYPIIKWNSTSGAAGLRFFSDATEIARFQDNGFAYFSSFGTLNGFNVSDYYLVRGTPNGGPQITFNGGGDDMIVINEGNGNNYASTLRLSIPSTTTKGLVVRGKASQSGNLQEWQDASATVLATVTENGYFTTRKTAAPADAELAAGELAFWLDSTAGAARFKIKAKNASGTVVTGELALA